MVISAIIRGLRRWHEGGVYCGMSTLILSFLGLLTVLVALVALDHHSASAVEAVRTDPAERR